MILTFFKNKKEFRSLFLNNFKRFSILKNKDQKGEHDKSYSGTDSKHQGGSDRVLDDEHKSGITTVVSDSNLHQHINKTGSDFSKEEMDMIGKVSGAFEMKKRNKAALNEEDDWGIDECCEEDLNVEEENTEVRRDKKIETPSDKQNKF